MKKALSVREPGVLSRLPPVPSPVTRFWSSPQPRPGRFASHQCLTVNKTSDKTTRLRPHRQFKHSSATQMLLFAGCQCAVLFRGRTNRKPHLFFFSIFFFIFFFPDSSEHCRFSYHRDQFHCSEPARSDRARLTHETRWSVSGENSQGGG